jgi:CubicO group peptidase (beta-lactamase class C family)
MPEREARSGARALADPKAAGIDPARLELFLRRARLDVEQGLLPSAQVALARGGALVAFDCIGETTPETRYVLQSAGRSVLAAAIWKVIGDAGLELDAPVAEWIPEFGTNGKDAVTLRHLLTHTGGFPLAPLGYPKMKERAARLAAFSQWRLTSPPGSQLEFHLTSAAWVIAELVLRATGTPLPDYLRAEIARPLGLGIELAVPVAEQGDVARFVATDALEGSFEVDPWGPWYLSDPEVLAAGEPSHAVVASAADLVLLFQALYHSGLWKSEVVAEATRVQVDRELAGKYGNVGARTRVGLFVMIDPPPTASPATFGHDGAASQMGWCDPVSGISFAFVTNGYPVAGYDRTRAGLNRIALLRALAFDCLA